MSIPSKEEILQTLEMRHGKEMQKRISESTVAICGLGGLGSNIGIALARAGVGHLILIDYDRVDLTNIHRQQYKLSQIGLSKVDALTENLREIAPYIQIDGYDERVNEENVYELIKQADIVCEAFDDVEAKAMLVNQVMELFPEKYLVAASGMAGFGPSNTIHTRKITKKFYLCGDETSDVSDGIGLIASRVMICAAHQAHTVIRIIAKELDV